MAERAAGLQRGRLSEVGNSLQSPTGRRITNTVTREITRSLFGTRRRR